MDIANYINNKLIKFGADDVIIGINKSKSSQIKFSNNKIVAVKNWDMSNLGIFMAIKKRLVTTTLKEISKKAADDTIKNIIKFSNHIKPSEEYKGIAKGPFRYKEIEQTYDKKISNVDGVDLIKKGVNAALNKGAKRVAGVLEMEESSGELLTSNNINARDKGTSIYFSIRALKDKSSSGHKVSISRVLNKFDVEKTASEAAVIAKMVKNPREGKAGTYDILFEPLVFANILDNLGMATSIFNVESGLSCLGNLLNKRIANNNFNLYDNGRLKNGLGSCKFDAEGVPTKKNILVNKGILKTFLYNTSTAKKYKTKTTANAGLIVPSPHNLILEKGDFSKEELLGEIKKGIWITNTWYTRFQDHTKGDFSTLPRDGIFYIENGKVKYPIKNIRISENLIKILKKVYALGNKQEQVRGWEVETPCLTPAVLAKGVNITKPK